MKTVLKITFLLVSFSLFAQGNIENKYIQALGFGISKQSSVEDALINALRKVKGVKIDSIQSSLNEMKSQSVSVNGAEADAMQMIEKISHKLRMTTNGKIDSYEVVQINKVDGSYEAQVEVMVKEYKTPGHSTKKRRKLVVIPSYSNSGNFPILGALRNSKEVTQRLTQELVSSVTQTRKFVILDRENNNAYNMEKSVLLSRDAQKDEMLKLGNVLGADYLLVSNITEFKIYNDRQTSSLTGRVSNNLKSFATVQYRILAMATKQVKWSNTTTFEFEPKGNTNEQAFLYTLKKISEDITYQLIENIFPIKVVDTISNNRAIINQGTTKIGQEYEVYKLGKKLYDSYTKEYLGRDEMLIGKVKVHRSLPKISYVEVIEGTVSKGAICRKIKTNTDAQKAQGEAIDKSIKVGNNGGVILF
ncbi:MAG: CsgG/HfaB family protein [Campylobacterota bacterium]|nr:CsgG/HfaB family protein [Campylobacterota bacterium]